jgi:hypothetical protein
VRDPEALDHQVKHVSQHADLVPGGDADPGLQVSLDHPAGLCRELRQRTGDVTRQENAGPQGQHRGRQRVEVQPAPHHRQLGEVDVRAEIHVQGGDRLSRGVLDGGEGGDPRAMLVPVDVRVTRGPLRQDAIQDGLDLRDQQVLLPHRLLPVADDGKRAFPAHMGQRVDGIPNWFVSLIRSS